MGTPTDARCVDFRIPSQKGTMDSGGDGKEFSRRTPRGEDTQEMPRQEKSEADDAQGTRKGRAEGESRDPETSTYRHDPGGSWLNKDRYILQVHLFNYRHLVKRAQCATRYIQ
ncbi:hypothetical protein NDU88_002801 [Pleurodeles waltl]|uniref:Uncharacterized protein n=1 Tax=Pleurodeles waltl TaxID=8319 RepID=A0AAV7RGL5_PLEWA|nr:hypothetical protein NDU88_002801 [Pleurodeles waltl]